MAKRKNSESASSYSYFKQLFSEHPEWLKEKSNAVITARYRSDHGLAESAEIEKKVMNNLSNLKSVMRKALRIKTRKAAKKAGTKIVRSTNKLEILEERIDDCLTMARTLAPSGFEEIIHFLRRARNSVVWKLGEK